MRAIIPAAVGSGRTYVLCTVRCLTRHSLSSRFPRSNIELDLRTSEGAVPRGWGVNATHCTCWNELDSDSAGRHCAFIADKVHVVTTRINKSHPHCVHLGFAGGIVSFIGCHRSCRDDDQTMTRMRMPAAGSPGLPDVALDVHVRQSLCLLHRQP